MTPDFQDRDDRGGRLDGLQDLLRRTVSSGVRGVLNTEEGIRNMVGELLPKEIGAYIKAQVETMRQDLSAAVIREFTTFLKTLDLPADLRKLLDGMKITVHAEIHLAGSEPAAPSEAPRKPRRKKAGR
ncbi:MAG: hypothetical protein FJ098_16780 [Deltaproteobacteria bacterium]|nr:hypothetical protein [Deltaproteobacteria bacterium]